MKKVNLVFIKDRRCEMQITLQEMAYLLGFKNASTYMKYEKGEYSLKAEHIPIIADNLKCKLNDLFFENNFADLANNL